MESGVWSTLVIGQFRAGSASNLRPFPSFHVYIIERCLENFDRSKTI